METGEVNLIATIIKCNQNDYVMLMKQKYNDYESTFLKANTININYNATKNK